MWPSYRGSSSSRTVRSIAHVIGLLPLFASIAEAVGVGTESQKFIGFTETASGTYTAVTCGESYTVYSSSTYIECAKEGDSDPLLIVGCASGTVSHFDGTTSKSYYSCTGSTSQCLTQTIFPTIGASTSTLSIGCGNTDHATLYLTPSAGAAVWYGDIPFQAATPTPRASGSSPASTTATPTANGDSQSSSNGLSGAAIAGIVVGCIAFAVIVATAIAFVILRKRLRRSRGQERKQYLPEVEAIEKQHELIASTNPVELPGGEQFREIDSREKLSEVAEHNDDEEKDSDIHNS